MGMADLSWIFSLPRALGARRRTERWFRRTPRVNAAAKGSARWWWRMRWQRHVQNNVVWRRVRH